jgi:hypothetical protein
MSQEYSSFTYIELTTHCTPGGYITVIIVLMNGDEVYASRMKLLLATNSDSALDLMFLIFENESQYQFSRWLLGEMILLA